MAIGDITYIRSGVEFTGISDVRDIKKTKSITVSWNVRLKYATDLTHLYLLRAVLNPFEAADLSKRSITDKFKVVYKWERDIDTGNFATSFVDEFKWDNNEDGNLHNLNVNNDRAWNEEKFNKAISRIVAGEQGVYYKIYGYSRRMNRAATPLGFFCDGRDIVALSQKNQVINDKWYSECGRVWKAGSAVTDADECFCRVAVDMERDLGEKPKKCRRVWASTSKGRIVEFDYWTGEIIGQISGVNNTPVYAIGFCAPYNAFLYYDGNGSVKMVTEDVSTHELSVVASLNVSDFGAGVNNARRAMGGICTWEGQKNSSGNPICYFYAISNREIVIKIKIENGRLSKTKIIPRTHFGCTTVHGTSGGSNYLGTTPNNQNNVYGIGAGANGQVWTNGHTPLTTMACDVKSEGNPIKVYVSLGRGATGYNSNGTARYPSFSESGTYGGCVHALRDEQWPANAAAVKAITGSNRVTDTVWQSWGMTGDAPDGIDSVYRLDQNTTYKKNFGNNPPKCKEANKFNKDVYDYSARFYGERRPENWTHKNMPIGCKGGIVKDKGVEWLRAYIDKYNRFGQKIDRRVLGAGTKITNESVADILVTTDTDEYPDNNPGQLNAIHHELVAVFDGDMSYTNVNFLQDLNYVYGCTDDENIYDTNGQIEEYQFGGGRDYREHSRAQAITTEEFDKSKRYFYPMTKWVNGASTGLVDGNKKYDKVFGYAGEPVVLENNRYVINGDKIKTHDKMVRKPSLYTARLCTGTADKGIFKDGVFNTGNLIDLAKYIDYSSLPMSIGSVSPMIPRDGRMRVDRDNTKAYNAINESNALSYDISFADRREGKIGLLSYSRASGSNADISYKETDQRVKYTESTSAGFKNPDASREYFATSGTHVSNLSGHLNGCPYHVVADSDNNLWFSTPSSIGKLQLLYDTISGGRNEKYVYNPSSGSGLYAFENNNTYFESSLVLLEKHASGGAKYENRFNLSGIENGESGGVPSAVYQRGIELVEEGNLALSAKDSSNMAYVYNYTAWYDSDSPVWSHLDVFGKSNAGAWNTVYTKTGKDFYVIKTNDQKLGGNLNNEFNSDNFGVNSLMQMNRVEVGPDIIHPRPLRPTADTRISRSVSTSHNDRCDTFDDQSFWDKRTLIFDNEQSTSGYDDLDTTHQIYNITTNGRHLIWHRYEYNDRNIVGSNVKRHKFDVDEDTYDLLHPDEIYDNSPEMVWLTPNYTTLVPPYSPLAMLSANSAYANNQYWVDLYLDYTPSVYNFWVANVDGVYECVQVGKHRSHVFERWPTPDFCIRGIGNSESTDKITDYDLVGQGFWGDCTNEP